MRHEDITPEMFDRFWNRVAQSPGINGCWPRVGAHHRGRPIFSVNGVTVSGSRFALISIFGDLPPHLPCVLHKCPGGSNAWCVNPAHLAPGTQAENVEDCKREGRAYVFPLTYGDEHWTHQTPERLARGDRNGARLHPDRAPRGSAHGMAKLTEPQVAAIREAWADGVNGPTLARQYSVGRSTIYRVVRGEYWRHVL